MMDFETKYPIEGTAALNPYHENTAVQQGVIIAFPGKSNRADQENSLSKANRSFSSRKNSAASSSSCDQSIASELRDAVRFFALNDFFDNLRHGSMQGVPSGRLSRWQTVAAACLFSALAFAVLFL